MKYFIRGKKSVVIFLIGFVVFNYLCSFLKYYVSFSGKIDYSGFIFEGLKFVYFFIFIIFLYCNFIILKLSMASGNKSIYFVFIYWLIALIHQITFPLDALLSGFHWIPSNLLFLYKDFTRLISTLSVFINYSWELFSIPVKVNVNLFGFIDRTYADYLLRIFINIFFIGYSGYYSVKFFKKKRNIK